MSLWRENVNFDFSIRYNEPFYVVCQCTQLYGDHNVWFEDISNFGQVLNLFSIPHVQMPRGTERRKQMGKNDYSITISENNLKKKTINCFLSSPPMSLIIVGNAFFFQISFKFASEIMGETWRERNFDMVSSSQLRNENN